MGVYWTFVKSFFVCQHFASDLSIDRLLTKVEDEESKGDTGFEHWNCECTCKCRKRKIEKVFALNTSHLGDPTTRYPMKSQYEDETYL